MRITLISSHVDTADPLPTRPVIHQHASNAAAGNTWQTLTLLKHHYIASTAEKNMQSTTPTATRGNASLDSTLYQKQQRQGQHRRNPARIQGKRLPIKWNPQALWRTLPPNTLQDSMVTNSLKPSTKNVMKCQWSYASCQQCMKMHRIKLTGAAKDSTRRPC